MHRILGFFVCSSSWARGIFNYHPTQETEKQDKATTGQDIKETEKQDKETEGQTAMKLQGESKEMAKQEESKEAGLILSHAFSARVINGTDVRLLIDHKPCLSTIFHHGLERFHSEGSINVPLIFTALQLLLTVPWLAHHEAEEVDPPDASVRRSTRHSTHAASTPKAPPASKWHALMHIINPPISYHRPSC